MRIKLVTSATFLLLCQPAFAALHVLPLHNNGTATLTISASSLNRIFVQRDRIENVRGLEGDYILKHDDDNGEIYIKPTSLDEHMFIPLFVTTEGGSHYQLNLKPSAKYAETWSIKPLDAQPIRAEQWERAAPYEQTVIELVQAMQAKSLPDGYAQSALTFKNPQQWMKGLEVMPLTYYQGDELAGTIYRLKNTGDDILPLNPTLFNQINVRAIATTQCCLAPKTSTNLYVVTSHDE